MAVPNEPQTSRATPANAAPPFSIKRSMQGFRSWWAQRAFRLAPSEARAETPAALRDAAIQFSARVWDIAQAQAHEQLAGERASVNERVTDAQAKLQQATLARGRAENHVAQLEKRLAAADKTRQDLEKQLAAAAAEQQKLETKAESLEDSREELAQCLEEADQREAELQKQIAALRADLAERAKDAAQQTSQQQQQLERAKQHYATLEAQLASLLEGTKSARQGIEKSGRGRG